MKKTLIAIAAIAATSAFAQVQITGTFDPSYAVTKTTSGTDVATNQSFIRNNSRGTTNFTFRINEDLGGGLKAIALAEFDFNAGVNTNQVVNVYTGFTGAATAPQNNVMGSGGGEVFTGLSGSMGSIKLGTANTPSLSTQAGRQPFGTKMGGGFGTSMGSSHVRESSSIVLASNVYSGFSAVVGNSRGTNLDATAPLVAAYTGSKSDVGLFYAAGPLRAGASYFSGLGVGQQNYMVQYDIGAATIYGGMHTAKAAGVDTNAGTNLAVKYALNGTMSVMGNMGKLDDKTAANADQTITGLGLDYALSKLTTAYVRYENRKVDNTTLATAVKQQTTTAFGLQVNF
jgi:predicted porin